MSQHIVNPYYAACTQRTTSMRPRHDEAPQYAKLPRAPRNGSPVPHLTSLYHFDEAGSYGDRRYPGNCSGRLIKDLLKFFQPFAVFDPLCGAPHNGSSVAQVVMWRPVLAPAVKAARAGTGRHIKSAVTARVGTPSGRHLHATGLAGRCSRRRSSPRLSLSSPDPRPHRPSSLPARRGPARLGSC